MLISPSLSRQSVVFNKSSDAGTFYVINQSYTGLSIPKAYSPALPVGTQHYYKSSVDALLTIFRAEKFRGLIRGIDAAMLRTACGSAVRFNHFNHLTSI